MRYNIIMSISFKSCDFSLIVFCFYIIHSVRVVSSYKTFDLEFAAFLKNNKTHHRNHDVRPCSSVEVWQNFQMKDLGTLINYIRERDGLSTNKIVEEIFGLSCQKILPYEDNVPHPDIPVHHYPKYLDFKNILKTLALPQYPSDHNRESEDISSAKDIGKIISSIDDENIEKFSTFPKPSYHFHKNSSHSISTLSQDNTRINSPLIIDKSLDETFEKDKILPPFQMSDQLKGKKIPSLPSQLHPPQPVRMSKHPPRSTIKLLLPPNVKPPANIEVNIHSEKDVPIIEPISVTLAPQMSTYDALYQAAMIYHDNYPENAINPYEFSYKEDNDLKCLTITGIADIHNSEDQEWHLTLKNINNEILAQGPCIPPSSMFFMRPGYKIHLQYVLKDDIS